MWLFLVIVLGTVHVIRCSDINEYDKESSENNDRIKYEETDKSSEGILDKSAEDTIDEASEEITTLSATSEPPRITTDPNSNRRYWLVSSDIGLEEHDQPPEKDDNEKDSNIKSKISTLVEQTLHDTERKLKSLNRLKERHKNEAPYKVGFILSLVKKSKDVLNELFNVAVKHRDDYKALEELKIFEFIVHTNVDTTNLVRQMVEIHIQFVNSSSPLQYKNRVVLL